MIRRYLFYLSLWWGFIKSRINRFLLYLYKRLKIDELVFFILFLFHRYSPKQFNPIHVPENLRMLVRYRRRQGLATNREGKIKILTSKKSRAFFFLKNVLVFRALQKRVERAVFYTYLTVTLELNNPFNKKVLMQFLAKKIAFLEHILEGVKKINGKTWDQSEIRIHIEIYKRNSLIQADVIEKMEAAVRRQKEPEVIRDAKEAIQKGLHPLLVTVGFSGTYWIRGSNRDIVGLFKPYDEEIHAPNNPLGPKYQGALGQRKTRWGCRAGESVHREVAAFEVDQFFGFGIVPKTYYASFSHYSFFSAREDIFSSRKEKKRKLGSFQEFVKGFVSLDRLSTEEINALPLDEYQLLIILDLILGNTDRNLGNILVGDEEIVAIDHGLCFSDHHHDKFTFWYWGYYELGKKPLYPAFVDLLDHFPFEKLSWRLKKNCFISTKALDRMRERIVLFTEGVRSGLVPMELVGLLKVEYLLPLTDLSETLAQTAQEMVKLYLSILKKEEL